MKEGMGAGSEEGRRGPIKGTLLNIDQLVICDEAPVVRSSAVKKNKTL